MLAMYDEATDEVASYEELKLKYERALDYIRRLDHRAHSRRSIPKIPKDIQDIFDSLDEPSDSSDGEHEWTWMDE